MKYFNDYDLRSYIRVYSNIDNSMCDRITNSAKSFTWEKHSYSDSFGNTIQFDNELEVSADDDFTDRSDLVQIIWNTIFQYKKEINFPWFQKWEGFSPVRFNKYSVGTTMRLHFDNIN